MIHRFLQNSLGKTKKSFLLLGPRQTGKSTLLRSLNPELEINLADEETFQQFLSDPGLIKRVTGKNHTVFVDEIQRLPSLLNSIQVILDNNKQMRFWMTGSSARKLKRGHANLLPGRILMYEIGPLALSELGDQFDIHRALEVGLLPGVYLEEAQATAQKILRSYAAIYLKEEIQAEALTRSLEGFSRFFNVMAAKSGEMIDFSKFSSQAMIERMSARRYFDIMIDTLVINAIEPFAKSTKRRLIQHPKFYFFDVGVLNGALSNFVASADRKGALMEHLFLQLVLSEAKARDEEIRVSSYRTEAGAEVDFIIEFRNSVFAVEVKASCHIGSHDLRGLKSFADYFGKKHTPIVSYSGELAQNDNGIAILPLAKAVQRIFEERPATEPSDLKN